MSFSSKVVPHGNENVAGHVSLHVPPNEGPVKEATTQDQSISIKGLGIMQKSPQLMKMLQNLDIDKDGLIDGNELVNLVSSIMSDRYSGVAKSKQGHQPVINHAIVD